MHNKVNERLEKPIFDCNAIEAKYPCGCDAEEEETKDEVKNEQEEKKSSNEYFVNNDIDA